MPPKHILMLNKFCNISFRSSEGLITLFLIIITFAAFWEVRHHEFLNFDDNRYVYDNPNIREGLTWKSIQWAFSTGLLSNYQGELWIPVTHISHLISFDLFGMDPSGHHLVNLLFHVLNTMLLFGVLHRMTGRMWQSAFVAALFAIHPLHVESVAWVVERKDVLSTFFWFLTMWAYLQYTKKQNFYRYLLVILAFALGLMAKPMLTTLPFVLLLLDYWPLRRLKLGDLEKRNWIKSGWPLIREKIPLFALASAVIVITFLSGQRGGSIGSLEAYPIWIRIVNAPVSYVSYIGMMFWPSGMAVFYPHPGKSITLWEGPLAGLLLVFISVFVVRGLWRWPYLIIGWLWYLGTLVPVIGLLQIGEYSMADRYTYVPFIGLFIMIAWGGTDLVGQWRYKKVLLSVSVGVILSVLMVVTSFQLHHWQNSATLFEHALQVTENNYTAHHNLGSAYQSQKRINEAIQQYQMALTIKSNFGSHINLGLIFHQQSRFEDAIREYQKALTFRPSFAKGHFNLGNAYQKLGRFDEAMQEYQRTLALKPNFSLAHFNLGNLYKNLGRFDEAIQEYRWALILKPDSPGTHNNLGVIYQNTGQLDEAIQEFGIALKLYPQFFEARKNLALATKEKRSGKAESF